MTYQIIDTDTEYNYCVPILENGFPVSTPKMRHFDATKEGRDAIIQPNNHTEWMLQSKAEVMDNQDRSFYHQDCRSEKVKDKTVGLMHNRDLVPKSWFLKYSEFPFDTVIVEKDEDQGSRVVFCHLTYPNGWAAEDAIGRPFSYFHQEVKVGGELVVPDNDTFLDYLIKNPKYHERIGAFSIKSEPILDRHPRRKYPTFQETKQAFVRFERQILFGIPEVDCFAFIIQTHIIDMKSRPELMKKAILNSQPDCYCHEVLNKNRDFLLDYVS